VASADPLEERREELVRESLALPRVARGGNLALEEQRRESVRRRPGEKGEVSGVPALWHRPLAALDQPAQVHVGCGRGLAQ
jgi:hypothetical protein